MTDFNDDFDPEDIADAMEAARDEWTAQDEAVRRVEEYADEFGWPSTRRPYDQELPDDLQS